MHQHYSSGYPSLSGSCEVASWSQHLLWLQSPVQEWQSLLQFVSLFRIASIVKYLLNFDKHPKLLKWYHDQNFAFPFLFIFGKQKCWVINVPSFIWKFEREVRLFLLEKFEKKTKNFRHSTTLSLRIKYMWLKLIGVLLARVFSKAMYARPKCVLSCYWSHLLVAPGYLSQ